MSTITVSGHLFNLNGSPTAGSVVFALTNYGDNLPRVLGSNAIAPITQTFLANASGYWTGGIQGNDTIDPGASNTPPTTYYVVSFIDANGKVIQSLPFQFTGSSAANLDTQIPIVTIPSPIAPPNNAGLLAASQTWSGSNSFTGPTSLSELYNLDSALFIDGVTYPTTAAGINAAITAIGSGTPGVIFVPHAGTYSDAVIALGKQQVLIFGAGTFTVAGITIPDSTSDATGTCAIYGQGVNRTTLQLANSKNVDVITCPDFGTLTGGTNFYGCVLPIIANLTVDGNKANNASGYGIRFYGRAENLYNLRIQNVANDGLWTEWGGTENDASASTSIQGYVTNLEIMYCGGNGWTNKGPNDLIVVGYNSHNNGSWGWSVQAPTHASHINVYENDLTSPGSAGGINTLNGGSLIGADIAGTNGTAGWGMLVSSTSGSNDISSGTWASGTAAGSLALEVRGGGAQNFIGEIGPTGTYGLKLNGAGGCLFILTFYSSKGTAIVFTSETVANTIITGNGDNSVTTWYSGTPAQSDVLLLAQNGTGSGTSLLQLGQAPLFQTGGWAHLVPTGDNTAMLTGGSTANVSNKTLTQASSGNNVTLLNYQSAKSAITGNNSDQTMWSYSLPANTVATSKGIKITAAFSHSSGSSNVTYKIKVNAAVITSLTSLASTTHVLYATIMAASSTTADGLMFLSAAANSQNNVATAVSSLAWTSNQTVELDMNSANTEQVTPQIFVIELIQ